MAVEVIVEVGGSGYAKPEDRGASAYGDVGRLDLRFRLSDLGAGIGMKPGGRMSRTSFIGIGKGGSGSCRMFMAVSGVGKGRLR